MKPTIASILLFIGSFTFGQSEKNGDEYLFQTLDIFDFTIWHELMNYASEFDSIQVSRNNRRFYSVDPTVEAFSLPADFEIRSRRHKIKTIKTSLIDAKFTYTIAGKVKKIKFNYRRINSDHFYEGTTDYYAFEYADGKLIKVFERGFYGAENYTFTYY